MRARFTEPCFLKIRSATDYIPGSGGVRDIISLRGDNDGLQRNRWPDRAHVRRGTYDLRRNSRHPLSTPVIHAGVATVAFLSVANASREPL